MPKVLRPWLWAVLWLAMFSLCYLILLKVKVMYLQQELSQVTKSVGSTSFGGRPDLYIGVGDSLLAFSLPHEQDFQALLGGQKKWRLYWAPNATWHSFEWIADADGSGYDSTTFILQESLFLNREKPSFADSFHWTKKSILDNLTAGNALKKSNADIFKFHRSDECNLRSNDKYAMEFTYKSQIINSDAQEFLHALQRQAKRVVVVSLPRAEMKKERLQNDWRKKLRDELEGEGIAFITLGQSMPDDYYCDGSHPNEKGRLIRTAQMRKLMYGGETSIP